MKYFPEGDRTLSWRLRSLVRAFVSGMLVVLLGLEVLPLGFIECLPADSGARGERASTLESLQVCDHGDAFLGVLFDVPILLQGTPCITPSAEALFFVQLTDAFAPDGFRPDIDHPPQLSA